LNRMPIVPDFDGDARALIFALVEVLHGLRVAQVVE
jgi:hypothetical protein